MKRYLNRLDDETLHNVIVNNEEFIAKYGTFLYDTQLEQQEEITRLILGDDWTNYIDYHEHYTSFYLKVKDCFLMIENINEDYLTNGEAILYKEIREMIDTYGSQDNWDYLPKEDEDKLLNDIEKKSEILLSLIEQDLHKYEEFPETSEVYDFIIDNDYHYNYYIIDNDYTTIYEDIIKSYK